MTQSYYEQGLEKIRMGDFQGAIESLSCAVREEAKNSGVAYQIYYQRGLALFELRDQQGAIADYTQALELHPQYFEAYLGRAIAYLANKNLVAALEDVQKAKTLNPDSAPARQLLGLIYKQQGQVQMAVTAYQQAANLFLIQQDEANCRRCINNYRQLQTLLPPTPQDFLAQVKQKISQGKSSEAMLDLDWTLQIDPKNAQALCLRGIVHSQKGNQSQALEDLNQALSLAPQDWEVRLHRGVIRRLVGDALGAIADFNQLLQENPQSHEAYANRGFARCHLQDYRQGIEDFSRAIVLQPESSQYYCDRGEARYQFGDVAGAINDYQEAANRWFQQGKTKIYTKTLDRIKTWQQELADQKLQLAQQQADPHSYDDPQPYDDFSVPSPELQQQLLDMVGGNKLIAQRLIDIARENYPDMPEEWYLKKVIFDLESEQGNQD
jgi:Flp pilus assembly protein TadD